jgi:putative DNA-invertase from lambdoid prophage Rac
MEARMLTTEEDLDVIGLYLRSSTDRQDVRTQRHALVEYCKKQLYPKHEVHIYADEGVSGTKDDRPALARLLKDAATGKIDRVIVFELSRLSRNMLGLLKLMEQLSKLNVTVETPREGPVPFDGSLQQFIVAAKSLVSAEERDNISRRTKAALAERKAAGIKLGARQGDQRRKGKLKSYETEEPETVARILKMRSRGFSTYDIAMAVSYSQSKVFRVLKRAMSNT